LTLADVAKEAGVAPATLVQRFGSKRGLLLALVREGSSGAANEFAAVRAAHSSPLSAIWALAECMARMAPTADELANHLAFLHIDLTDPEFHYYALAHARAFHVELSAMVEAAIAAGELAPCDSARLARVLEEVLHGGLVTWAIYREGTAEEWLRHDLETLLGPYLVDPVKAPTREKKPRRNAN
jgi:AcrR family transcriptional regulator